MYVMHGMHNIRIKKTVSCTFTIPTVREEALPNVGTFTKIFIMKELFKNKVKCNCFQLHLLPLPLLIIKGFSYVYQKIITKFSVFQCLQLCRLKKYLTKSAVD